MAGAGCLTSAKGPTPLSTMGIGARLQSLRLHRVSRAQLRPPVSPHVHLGT